MMKLTLIAVLVISSGTVLSSALSCFNLEQKAGRGNLCYIQENADKEVIDKELVGPTPKCTDKDIKQGTAGSDANSSFCFMAVLRGTASATTFNSSTNTSTTVTHSVVLVERGTGFIGPAAANCSQQCKYIEKLQEIGNTATMNRILLYFACGNGDNTNGDDATNYKSRTDKFNCDNFQLSQITVPPKSSQFPLWLIIVIVVAVAALVLLIIVAVVMVCVRRKKAGEHPNAAYRAQQNASEPAAALNM
jgi:hypothetical protein